MPRVEKYMQTKFCHITDTALIVDALKTMFEKGSNYLLVLRGGIQIAGIVTRTDIMNLHGSIVLKEGYIRDLIGDQTLIAVTPQDYMQDALNRFERYANIDQLIVLNLLEPVGVLSRDDVIRWIYDEEYPNLLPD